MNQTGDSPQTIGQRVVPWILATLCLAALTVISRYNYLLFHTLAELFSIVIAWSFFTLVWNTRRYIGEDYLILLGIASLFVGAIDLVHTLAYKGMGVFSGYDANLPTQLWIAARYLQSFSVLAAGIRLMIPPERSRPLNTTFTLAVYTVITVFFLVTIFARVFPACYIEGSGLTLFKKSSELVISFILLVSFFLFLRARDRFDSEVLRLLLASLLMMIGAELAFIFYVGVYDFSNLIGHLLKIAAFYLLFLATVFTGLRKPFALLFRNLKQNEEKLQESEARYRNLFENSPLGIFRTSLSGEALAMNSEMARIVGYATPEEAVRDFRDIAGQLYVDPNRRIEFLRLLQQDGEVSGFEYQARRRDGRTTWISMNARLSTDECDAQKVIDGFASDVTERKRSEEERLEMERWLLQAQKLESLGLMAGGIAHDFNNLLQVVMGNLELAQMDLPPNSPIQKQLGAAFQAAEKSAELSHKMLAYAGRIMFMPRDLDINEVVEKSTDMLKSVVSNKAFLTLKMGEHLPSVSGDSTQILQVLTNLVTNASEAFGDKSGEIQVSTGVIDCDEAYLSRNRIHNKVTPGGFVFLEVADTGSGMDEKTQELLFDPFFTTKFIGRGLGMSAVMGIVKGHGGAILVDSQADSGTTIRVLFPVSKNAEEPPVLETEMVTGAEPAPASASRTSKMLVVDDDEGVLDLALRLVSSMGYDVISARDGEEAIRLFSERSDAVTGVILDYSMPQMNGMETFKELSRIKPDVKVILCSGYSEEETCGSHEQVGLAGFLHKPYGLAQLRQKIEEVLENTVSTSS